MKFQLASRYRHNICGNSFRGGMQERRRLEIVRDPELVADTLN
jgi:hypothetical protein